MASLPMVASGGSKVAVGTFTASLSGTVSVNLGFQPKKLVVWNIQNDNTMDGGKGMCLYDDSFPTNNFFLASDAYNLTKKSWGTTETYALNSITSTGFVMNKVTSANYTTWHYFAIGE